MSYPKWLSRGTSVAYFVGAFVAVGDSLQTLYYQTNGELTRLNDWCETAESTMAINETVVADLPTSSYQSKAMIWAQDLMWLTVEAALYTYDPATDTLDGPWGPPTSESNQVFIALAEYAGEIYVLEEYSNGGWRTRLLKFTGAGLVSVYLHPDAAFTNGMMAVFQEELYFPASDKLMSWDGSTATQQHAFGGSPKIYVGALRVLDENTLYVGTGSTLYPYTVQPHLRSWNGATMTDIIEVNVLASPKHGELDRLVIRAADELYVHCGGAGVVTTQIYRIDPTVPASNLEYTDAYSLTSKDLIYWAYDDTVWTAAKWAKVFSPNLCEVGEVARTYFFLA